MNVGRLLVLLVAALGVAGCGGSEPEERASPAPIPDYSRLSGASVYASLDQLERGWKTDFSKHTVPLSEFQRGGPGRDGIAAVDDPWVVPVEEVDFLETEEPVLEVVINHEARAYPFGILLLHEIVNDRVGGVPVVVTFCPLCNTALAFDRRVRRRTLSFATTGNLRNADLVMYDRQTESWWQQFGGEALRTGSSSRRGRSSTFPTARTRTSATSIRDGPRPSRRRMPATGGSSRASASSSSSAEASRSLSRSRCSRRRAR